MPDITAERWEARYRVPGGGGEAVDIYAGDEYVLGRSVVGRFSAAARERQQVAAAAPRLLAALMRLREAIGSAWEDDDLRAADEAIEEAIG